ncbi:hypothetical protein ERO13_A04G130606v2 [Gossypium hirsutum]|uniref:TF-B3 domain-containing protein n=3 Tax=Gossypium TaxID=3633 RepID=A0A2P5XTA3_GOSBA|nr:hypothetical protein ES319_A04G159900v1 [Gossypium barbadense]KAG4205926.1 hypothetical protein ERO13_A04G130606v2 [Gossypium hirsutum]PPS06579.1 hypothetical protein GOBAR_AA14078 [Gossypium barbadense]TYI34021.1 hypothetical protein ES332_A04G174400v1 [Gossypium tomentosum]TYJ40828.1 hypothetical protein E1A91_A04G168400v1 [Gossypium mustelinum]
MTDHGKVRLFCCSIRWKKDYPKPVLGKGWLPVVQRWKLAIGDTVMGYKRIGVIRGECLPLVQNHDAEEPSALAVASYTDVEEEATVASNSSTGRTVNHEQTEGLQNQPGLMFEYISLKPDITVSEPKVIELFGLGSQEQREMEHPSILAPHNKVEMPVSSSRAPYFKFL